MAGQREGRKPTGYWFVVAALLSAFGDALIPLVLAFAVLTETQSIAAFGFTLAAARLPQIVATVMGGVLGDRWNCAYVIVAASVLNFLLNIACWIAFLSSDGMRVIVCLVSMQIVASTVATFTGPAVGKYVGMLFTDELSIKRVTAVMGTWRSVMHISAQAVSGLLFYLGAPGACYFFNAVSFIILAVAAICVRPPVVAAGGRSCATSSSLARSFLDGVHAIKDNKPFMVTLLNHAAAWLLIIQPFLILGPATLARDAPTNGSLLWGGIGVALGVGGVVGGYISNKVSSRHVFLILLLLPLVDMPLFVVLACSPTSPVIFICAFLAGLQSTWARVWITQQIYSGFKQGVLGRVHAMFLVSWLLPAFLSSLVLPLVADLLTIPVTLLVLGVSFVLINLFLILALFKCLPPR